MIFNTKYANQSLIKNSFINYLLYYISSPIVFISFKLKLTPNTLTTASILATFLSVIFLYKSQILMFQFIWLFAVLLDYSDGPLARKTQIFSKGFDYDHLSDLFKICFMTASVAIFHNEINGIILSFLFIFIFLLNSILDKEFEKSNISNQTPILTGYLNKKIHPFYVKIAQQIYNTFFVFHGHSLLLFLVSVKSIVGMKLILSYYSILILKKIASKLLTK